LQRRRKIEPLTRPAATLPEYAKGEIMGFGAIIGWAIFGLIAGAIAKLIMPGKDPGGWFVTMLLGIAGALLGGFIGRALWGSSGVTGWGLGSWLLAIGGACLLLFIYRMVVGRRTAGIASSTDVSRRDRDKWAA
jgi:uncharacterized membrane protein YeaQ/YmgE (transglycosylase-associated protein family)